MSTNLKTWLERADHLVEASNFKDALDVYKLILNQDSTHPKAWYGMAKAITKNFTSLEPQKDYILAIANALKFSEGEAQKMIQSTYKTYIQKRNQYDQKQAEIAEEKAIENIEAWKKTIKKIRIYAWLSYVILIIAGFGVYTLFWPQSPAITILLSTIIVSLWFAIFLTRRVSKSDKTMEQAKTMDLFSLKSSTLFKGFILPFVLFFVVNVPLFNSGIPQVDWRYDPTVSEHFILEEQNGETIIRKILKSDQTVVIPKEVTLIRTNTFDQNVPFKHIKFEEGSQLHTIEQAAFYNTINLESIILPSSLRTLGEEAFRESRDLNTVSFETGSSLSTIESYAFADTEALNSIEIPNSVTIIKSRAFQNTTALETISFEADASLGIIEERAFSYSGIESIIIPSSVNTIQRLAFEGTTALAEITFLQESYPSQYDRDMFINTNPNLVIYVPYDAYGDYEDRFFGMGFMIVRLEND